MTDPIVPDEIWKPIPRFEGLYEASDIGRVRSLPRKSVPPSGLILKGTAFIKGRIIISLRVHKKRERHSKARLVALAFLGQPPTAKHEVNHIDGDPSNDRIENLEWVTHTENVRHSFRTGINPSGERSPHAKLTNADVAQIRHLLKTQLQKRIAKQFNVQPNTISRIKTGRRWKHLKS